MEAEFEIATRTVLAKEVAEKVRLRDCQLRNYGSYDRFLHRWSATAMQAVFHLL